MGIAEGVYHLCFDNDFVIDQQVGNHLADEVAAVMYRIFALLLGEMAHARQLQNERVFIKLFVETRLEFI